VFDRVARVARPPLPAVAAGRAVRSDDNSVVQVLVSRDSVAAPTAWLQQLRTRRDIAPKDLLSAPVIYRIYLKVVGSTLVGHLLVDMA
jgi:hypothetical protein